ncbi:partner of Y14 and mago-like isoform X1 [Penaeus chinensis]|uniref:partner of Y14 and mago-like isoform X1 n=1 Tax=Penaeus chinensis TaxID=139456 RepID=UPI001FB7019C|nr:partner of Y14 and mago-like isoform X1 [Penaeus chinensis]
MSTTGAEYVKDESGQCFIPPSQRPDGTWRKARRVKDGYVPQEEMPLYESKGKQWAKSRSEYPVGLNPTDIASAKSRVHERENCIPGLAPQAKQGGLSKSQKKKAARKKASTAEAEITNALEDTHIAEPVSGKKQAVATDPAKRLRNLRKKLKDTEKLEKQIESGELKNPEPEQREKVKKKAELISQIEELEKEVGSN